MENVPKKSDAEETKSKSTDKKKKKNTEALGLFALGPEPASAKSGESDNLWEKLTLAKRRGGQTEAITPLTEALRSEDLRRLPEVDEAHLEKLTPDEEQFIVALDAEQKLKNSRLTGEARISTPEEEAGGEAIDAHEAVGLFYKDLLDGKPREQAFRESLARLEPVEKEMVVPKEINVPQSTRDTQPAKATEAEEPLFIGQPEAINIGASNGTTPLESVRASEAQPPSANEHLIEGEQDQESPAGQRPSSAGASGGGVPPTGNNSIVGGGNVCPAPAAGAAVPRTEKEYVPYYNAGDVMSGFLVGGVIGYLVGRRRGRIKTERKLKPIQKKLEKQVKDLHEDIRWKEFYIRKAAHQQKQDKQGTFKMEQMRERETTKKPDESRQIAPEANQLHGKKVSPERIGQVLVAAGQPKETINKQEKAAEIRKPLKSTEKQIVTMSRSELLDLSEKISVENTTLRQVYETHLISEQGLRRLVNEHMRGGNVQKVLRRELVEHEIDFERDPLLRDKVRPVASSATGSTTSLDQLLQKAEATNEIQAKDEMAVFKARQAHHEAQRQKQQKSRRVLDISMVTAIVVLFVLVVTLLLQGV